jgi:glycosyltransferase involved in cell wall biosynthesis
MRILQVHNQYVSGLGGEDTVVRLEEELLRSHGHEVRQLIVSTSKLRNANALRLLQAGVSSVWSKNGYESVAKDVKEFQPDVVHIHNTFPLLSPSVYYAARRNGACVVQTLHNYRIACTNGLLLRNGMPCEDCVGRAKWRGLLHRCYHGSAGISFSVVAIQTSHQVLGTFQHEVDAFIALTAFQRDIVIRDGLPADRVHVKPNFTPKVITACERIARKPQIVYVGNIGPAKGTDLLLDAWTKVRAEGFQLLLLGHGPDQEKLRRLYASDDSVTWMGFKPAAEVERVLGESKYLVVCSRWYETFGMVLLEAFSSGTPVIAPKHAAFPEMLGGGKCGYLFEPSNLDSLVHALRLAVSTRGPAWLEQSDAALAKAGDYSAVTNYARLMEIYAAAQEHYSSTR